MCVCVAMVAVTTGCTSKKVDGDDSINTDSTEADEADTVDSVDSATEVIAATPMPKAADQLFDASSLTLLPTRNYNATELSFHCQSLMVQRQQN